MILGSESFQNIFYRGDSFKTTYFPFGKYIFYLIMNLIGISYVNVVTLRFERRNPFHNCFRNYNSTITTFLLITPFIFFISSIQVLKSKKDMCSKDTNLLNCQHSDLDVFYYNYFIWTTSYFLGLNFTHLDHGIMQKFTLNPK